MQGSINFDGSLVGNITGGGGGGGSEVVINPVLTSGTKIADVTVDGEDKDLFAPTPTPPTPATKVSVTQVLTEGTKIASIEVDGDSIDIYAPEGGGSEVEVDPILPRGTKIATITVNGVNHDIYSPDYSGDISSLQTGLSTANSNITTLQGRMTTAEGNITTLQSDMADAESIIGDGQLDIGNDLTNAVNEINQSLSQLDGLAIYKQVIPTGNTASFIANDSMQIIKLESNIIPSQDLHGYDSPWAGGAGKNKLGSSSYGGNYGKVVGDDLKTGTAQSYNITTDGTVTVESVAAWSGVLFVTPPLEAGSYSISAQEISVPSGSNPRCSVYITDSNLIVKRAVSYKQYAGNYPQTDITVESGDRIAYGVSNSIANSSTTITNFYIAKTNDLPSGYTPYSNICPISGFTDIVVSLSPTLDSQDATIYTTNFVDSNSPLTVYGGYIDIISGLLTVTDANIASYAGEDLPSTWISDRDVYTSGETPTTGAQVVYKLASALSYQLTAQQINALVGQNYIWADTGTIKEVGYLDILHLS